VNTPIANDADLRGLLEATAKLTDRVERLSIAVEELTIELEWRNNNSAAADQSPTRFVLTSMPLDPATTDWQINRVQASDLHALSSSKTASQQSLFD